MPEGDTIFRAARTLHRALSGKPVVRFESVLPSLTRVHEDHPLTGRIVEEVRSVGKHLLMQFAGDLVLRTHMKMNGSWHIYRPGERWQKPRIAMRVLVATADFEAVGFSIPVAEFMTVRELQDVFKIRIVRNETTGLTQVFSMPQDIIDNTRAAFNSDPTTATGYSLALGVPEGRYLRPPSEPGCTFIYRGDCNTPDINLNGPLFTRVDLRLKKMFRLGGRATMEVDFELLNALDNINFNHSVAFNPATSGDTFRVTSAYTDANTTNDPGGRLGQLAWRINW